MEKEQVAQSDVQGRRQALKIGAGVAAAAVLSGKSASAANINPAAPVVTQNGWKNDANRASGNGPMDETSRQIVKFVHSFSDAQVTPKLMEDVGTLMVDSLAALISGFESEPARICARLAKTTRSDQKSTVLGYGVTTTPVMASFANGCMLRHTDFNDIGPVPEAAAHISDIISGPLAVAEAMHATGRQLVAALAVGYEVTGALSLAGATGYTGWDGLWEGPGAAMAVGKLLGLNEDQLANALSLSLVPHVPLLVTHVGPLSHWKGCHSSEAIRSAVWATYLAKEGMTGPCQPFEARNGVWDHEGAFRRPLQIPEPLQDGKMVIQRMGYKRTPSEGSSQALLEIVPDLRSFTKADDIASMHIEMPFGGWQEIGDPPKWDPQNRETADHSLAYIMARAMIDGEIYLGSFTRDKYMDPSARALMAKITISPNPDMKYMGQNRITIKKKSGEQLVKETNVHVVTQMTAAEVAAKFSRVCSFMKVADSQRDGALKTWTNLGSMKNVADAMAQLAHFGQPAAL